MLEAEKQGEEQGHFLVETEEGGGLAGLVHEGEVWAEEEGVVVVADEAISSRRNQYACLLCVRRESSLC